MLAVIGWIAVDLGARIPGSLFYDVSTTISAHNGAVGNGSMG